MQRRPAAEERVAPPAERLVRISCGFLLAAVTLLFALAGSARADDFSFVDITDTHLNGIETPDSHAAKLADRLREIAALKPAPSFIIDTGDITENGAAAQFASFARIRAANLPSSIPLYFAPGNHDVRWSPPAGDVFQQESGQPRFRSWDHGIVHFVLLDSTVPLEHWGHFDQAQLEWLAKDLRHVGPARPIIIGFHHWIGRPPVMVDNEDDLLRLLAPYNVRLFLIGHGHADLLWNVNGAPAVMARALFDGSYYLVHISGDRLQVFRRTTADPNPTVPLISEPLHREGSPKMEARAVADANGLKVTLDRDDLPAGTTAACQVDGAKPVALDGPTGPAGAASGWTQTIPLGGVVAGVHRILITATLPDGRTYELPIALTLSRSDGITPVWSVDLKGAVQGRALVEGQTVYVPTMGGALYALDTVTGAKRWEFDTGGCLFGPPILVKGTLYFGAGDGYVYAVNPERGTLRWRTRLDAPVLAGVAFAANLVCAATAGGRVAGLDPEGGKIVWSVTPAAAMYQARPATDGRRLFLGDWSNNFLSLDAATGQPLWKVTIGKSFYYSAAIGFPALNADSSLVYVSSDDGVLHAIETKTGAERWQVNGPALGYSGPLFQSGRIYNASLTDTGHVFCFDAASGEKRWDTETGSVIYDSSCCAAGGDVCVGCVDGTLAALHAADGSLDWEYRLGAGHLLSSPVADAERIYIGSESGRFFAFPVRKAP